MPHVNGGGDDFGASDEIKVYKHEGAGEESSAEILIEDKSSLVIEVEAKNVQSPDQGFVSAKSVQSSRPDTAVLPGKPFDYLPPTPPFGYVISPYHHHPVNGTLGAMPMVNKMPMVSTSHAASPLSLMMYNSEAFQPPPAHMGIPPVHIDPKTGIPRPSLYPITTPGQYHHPMFSPDFSQQFQWHPSGMYSMASSFRGAHYSGSLTLGSNNLPKFSPPTLIPPHPGISSHPALSHHPLLSQGPKTEICESNEKREFSEKQGASHSRENNVLANEKKKSHIKKPLNAFMLYMKEMRSKVVAECTLKESAAINQILGRKWHSLTREEQAKYYEMARKERQLHMQLYPGWSARDNYAQNTKKKKRKRDKLNEGDGNNPKKCRARFGLDQQSSWCKPCRRKKKCIRYISSSENNGESEDNIGSVESMGSLEAPTPDSKCDGNDALSDDEIEDSDSDNNLNMSSELSLSSPPVPSTIDNIRSMANGLPIGSPPCNHHPLSVQHLSQPSCSISDSPDTDTNSIPLPQLPTPPSTDSSTTAAPSLLTVT